MKTLGDLYQEYVVELDPIMWEAGRVNGIHVDNEARLEALSTMDNIINTLNRESQPLVPEFLYPTKHYVNPPETDRPVRPIQIPNPEVKTCSNCGLQHVTKGAHTGKKGGSKGVPLNPCYKAPIELKPGIDTEYDVVLPFNPGSDDQLREYAAHYKHRLGRNWRTQEETLDEKQLQKFINRYGVKHPIYTKARDIRKTRKSRGYAKAWVPDENGLLYGHFKNTPETLRFSQSEHNFMNVSHRGNVPFAKELRRALIAPPGYMLVEADSASVEAVFTGKLMGSESYVELARKGIHAWWALKKLGMEAIPENIAWIREAEEHSILYDTKKRTVHGVSYGMGAKLLHEEYPEYFPTKADAQREIDEFYTLVPDLHAWHLETQKRAHSQGFLKSPWGFKNYYYRVFTFDWKAKLWSLGEDAKATIAFQPQHANAMFQRENLKLIYSNIKKMGKSDKWKLTAIGHIHDSNGLRVPEDDTMKAAEMMAEVMNRPVKQMGNVVIGVKVKAGKNWQDMKGVLSV